MSEGNRPTSGRGQKAIFQKRLQFHTLYVNVAIERYNQCKDTIIRRT